LTEDYGLKLLTAMTNVLQNPLTHSLNEHKEKSIVRMMEYVVLIVTERRFYAKFYKKWDAKEP